MPVFSRSSASSLLSQCLPSRDAVRYASSCSLKPSLNSPPSRSVTGASSLIASVSSLHSLSMSHIIARAWLSSPSAWQSSNVRAMSGSTSNERLSARQSRALSVPYAKRESIRSRSHTCFSFSRSSSAAIGWVSMNSIASCRAVMSRSLSKGCSIQSFSIREPIAVQVLSSSHKREPRRFLSRSDSVNSRLRRAVGSSVMYALRR